MKRISKLEAFQFMNEDHFSEYERIIKHLELNYYVGNSEILFDLEEETNLLYITFHVANIDTGQDYEKTYTFDVSKKMGRPSIGVTKKVSLTLPEETWEKISEVKEEEGTSQSAILRDIVERYYRPSQDDADPAEKERRFNEFKDFAFNTDVSKLRYHFDKSGVLINSSVEKVETYYDDAGVKASFKGGISTFGKII